MRRLLLLLLMTPALAGAAEHMVNQKNKTFSTTALTVKVGDKVSFRNDDSFLHNIFSLTDTMPFDLGAYSQGQVRSVTFTKAGKFDVECAIHPEMKLSVTVTP